MASITARQCLRRPRTPGIVAFRAGSCPGLGSKWHPCLHMQCHGSEMAPGEWKHCRRSSASATSKRLNSVAPYTGTLSGICIVDNSDHSVYQRNPTTTGSTFPTCEQWTSILPIRRRWTQFLSGLTTRQCIQTPPLMSQIPRVTR